MSETDTVGWIIEEATDHDDAPGGGIDDCTGATLEGTVDQLTADDELAATLTVPVEGLDGVNLPDNDEAAATYGDGTEDHEPTPPTPEPEAAEDEAAYEADVRRQLRGPTGG